MAPPWMRVSERWSQRSLRSLRMVCADTSKRRARSSTITRPKARAMLRISVWRCDSPATAGSFRQWADMVRRFGGAVNVAEAWRGAGIGENVNLVKARCGVRSRKND